MPMNSSPLQCVRTLAADRLNSSLPSTATWEILTCGRRETWWTVVIADEGGIAVVATSTVLSDAVGEALQKHKIESTFRRDIGSALSEIDREARAQRLRSFRPDDGPFCDS